MVVVIQGDFLLDHCLKYISQSNAFYEPVISAKTSNTRPCWSIQCGEGYKFWSESSSTLLLCVCEQRRLWRVCAFAQARLSLCCLTMRYVPPRGGGGGVLQFLPHTYARTQHLPFTPPKNIRNFKHPKKIFEILATPKNIPNLYLDLKKDPKLHRNDPQTSPILWWPPKNIHKIFIPQKNIHFLKTPKNIEIQKFTPQKIGRAYVCVKISEYLPWDVP